MATYTENYDLVKPDESDYYNINTFNDNMDMIDSLLAETHNAMQPIGEKIDSISDSTSNINQKIGSSSTGNTLFSLLENNHKSGLTAIKSIQHLVFSCPHGQSSTAINLNHAVDPKNCIALWERLYGTGHVENYTINEATLSITHGTAMGTAYIFGCWIIEFM